MSTQTASLLFEKASKLGASDVHIAVGSPILFRIDGQLVPQSKQVMSPTQGDQFVRGVIGETSYKRLKEMREIDVSFELPSGVRMRVNCMYERGNVGLIARIIPNEIPSLEALGLQHLAEQFCSLSQGFILFTGPTGSGKSSSLAAIIDYINHTRAAHIVTLEDPIEFVFGRGQGLIRQRQYGQDFLSFAEAMKRVLRQDPDIVMVGEMRDPETIATALTLAETGHLIFATLHTPNTIQTVDRIIDVFPSHQQAQIRSQLSMSLTAIVAQKLLPKEGGGRVALREVLLNTPAVANIIRTSRAQELKTVLQTSESIGMITFAKAAKRLYDEGAISKEIYELVMASI
ncbi:MAG: twitching motility protein PilT [Candidatus Peribacteria bacterium]|nr:twitching motility protein PilT [Candidatus Peribacteria bacterium]